jgi:hypothetical protein
LREEHTDSMVGLAIGWIDFDGAEKRIERLQPVGLGHAELAKSTPSVRVRALSRQQISIQALSRVESSVANGCRCLGQQPLPIGTPFLELGV